MLNVTRVIACVYLGLMNASYVKCNTSSCIWLSHACVLDFTVLVLWMLVMASLYFVPKMWRLSDLAVNAFWPRYSYNNIWFDSDLPWLSVFIKERLW